MVRDVAHYIYLDQTSYTLSQYMRRIQNSARIAVSKHISK